MKIDSSVIYKKRAGIDISDVLSIESENLKDSFEYLVKNNLDQIALSSYYGFKFNDLAFLKEYGKLIKGVSIGTPIDDISELYNHPHLETIFIYPDFYDELYKTFDVTRFPNLKHFIIPMGMPIGLEHCENLAFLRINKYPYQDLSFLKSLTKLESLDIRHSRKIESVDGIENFPRMKMIELLYLPKLSNIEKLSTLKELRYLFIGNCKKLDNSVIQKYKHLPFFSFNGQKYSV